MNTEQPQTYAQSQGEAPFDWNQWLDEIPPDSVPSDLGEKRSMAQDWVTCACGNVCALIPRRSDGRPTDEDLYDLGCEFAFSIDHELFSHAKGILAKIESRSAFLLSQMGKETK